jgi:lysophospholipase L1-like esterase
MKLSTRQWSRAFLRSTTPDQALRLSLPGNAVGATFGDSHANGVATDTATALASACSLPFVDLGVNGETTTQVVARLAQLDAANVRLAVVIMGINDVNTLGPMATFLANYATLLAYTAARNIHVVAVQMFPAQAYDNTKHANRVVWNAALAALVAQYSHAQTLNLDATLGLFRAGGPAGNLYDLQAAYNHDDYHLSVAGNSVFAAAVAGLAFPAYLATATGAAVANALAGTTDAQADKSRAGLGLEWTQIAASPLLLQAEPQSHKLLIPTPYGTLNEVTHPSVIRIPGGFGPDGHEYIMLMQPYPEGELADPDGYEDICVVSSPDGEKWTVPTGLTNPIYSNRRPLTVTHDGHITYADGMMYSFWEEVTYTGDPDFPKSWYMYSTSTDLVNWTNPVTYEENPDWDTGASTYNEVSRCFIKLPDGYWHMWAVDLRLDRMIVHAKATTIAGLAYGSATRTVCTRVNDPVDSTANNTPRFWHMDVQRVGSHFVLATMIAARSGVNNRAHEIILATSPVTDGNTFTFASQAALVANVWLPSAKDNALYRPTLDLTSNPPRLFYGSMTGFAIPAEWGVCNVALKQIEFPVVPKDKANELLSATSLIGRANYAASKLPLLVDIVDRADSATVPGLPTAALGLALGGGVSKVAGSGTAATITTVSAHGLAAGTIVKVALDAGHSAAFDNAAAVIATVPTTLTFTYANTTVLAEEAATGTVQCSGWNVLGGGTPVIGTASNRLYYVSGGSSVIGVQFDPGTVDTYLEATNFGGIASQAQRVYIIMTKVNTASAFSPSYMFGFEASSKVFAVYASASTKNVMTRTVAVRTVPETLAVEHIAGTYTFFYNGIRLGQFRLNTALTNRCVALRMQHADVKWGNVLVRKST